MMGEELYFVAIVPPKDIQHEVTRLKELVADRFQSKHALKSPPHITLHMPFRWKEKKFGQLAKVMQQLNKDLQPFEVQLKDFDFFEPRVVFVDVMESQALLRLQKDVVDCFRKELKLDNGNYKGQGFHPHVTIGFRDLKKPMFFEAKKEFEERTFQAKFMAEELTLLKHNGQKWEITAF